MFARNAPPAGSGYNLSMAASDLSLVLLGALWAAYGAWHSFSASVRAKAWFMRRFPRGVPAYRLIYNALAVLLLFPPLLLLWSYRDPPLWRWPDPLAQIAQGVALLALAGFAASLHAYDLGEFLGLAQLRGAPSDAEPMRISVWHRFVRHPWYCFGLVVLWSREMNAAWLITAVVLTAYLVIGMRLEERKLLARYGDAYRRYRDAVPALIPHPWRRLTRRQAEAFQTDAASRGLPPSQP